MRVALRLTPKECQDAGKFSPSFKGPHIRRLLPCGTTGELSDPVSASPYFCLFSYVSEYFSPWHVGRVSHHFPASVCTLRLRTAHLLLAHTSSASRVLPRLFFLCLFFNMSPARGCPKAPRAAQGPPAMPRQPASLAWPGPAAPATHDATAGSPHASHATCHAGRYSGPVSDGPSQARRLRQGRGWHGDDASGAPPQELVYLLRRLMAYRALRGDMWRVLFLGARLSAVWDAPPEELRDLSMCELDDFLTVEQLRTLWPAPFERLERLWDGTYSNELPEVVGAQQWGQPSWTDFLRITRATPDLPARAHAGAVPDDVGTGYTPTVSESHTPVDRLHIYLARMGVLEEATPAATSATPSAPSAVPPAPAPAAPAAPPAPLTAPPPPHTLLTYGLTFATDTISTRSRSCASSDSTCLHAAAPAPLPQFEPPATLPDALQPVPAPRAPPLNVPAALVQQSTQSLSLALAAARLSPTAPDLYNLVRGQPALVPPPNQQLPQAQPVAAPAPAHQLVPPQPVPAAAISSQPAPARLSQAPSHQAVAEVTPTQPPAALASHVPPPAATISPTSSPPQSARASPPPASPQATPSSSLHSRSPSASAPRVPSPRSSQSLAGTCHSFSPPPELHADETPPTHDLAQFLLPKFTRQAKPFTRLLRRESAQADASRWHAARLATRVEAAKARCRELRTLLQRVRAAAHPETADGAASSLHPSAPPPSSPLPDTSGEPHSPSHDAA
ncbi:hypothetical protein Efla_003391 [Eimeria flavescens]